MASSAGALGRVGSRTGVKGLAAARGGGAGARAGASASAWRAHAMPRGSVVVGAVQLQEVDVAEQVGKMDIVDEEKMLSKSTFPIPGDKLIQLTKAFLGANNGCDDPSLLSEDFEFRAPIIGPIGKADFIKAFGNFSLNEAFPDARANAHAFRVDPFEPNRVWFTTRFTATHTGTFAGAIKPTGKTVVSPPQDGSCRFNEDGQVTLLTAGYVIDKDQGNTGGLGAVFGILYAIGKPFPFPEGKPYKPSWQFKLWNFVFAKVIPAVRALFTKLPFVGGGKQE